MMEYDLKLIKGTTDSSLLSSGSVALGKVSCHVGRTVKQCKLSDKGVRAVEGELPRGRRKFLGVMNVFIFFIVVTVL